MNDRCKEILNDWIDWETDDTYSAIDQLRSLNSCGTITQEEYDYITEHWDELLD